MRAPRMSSRMNHASAEYVETHITMKLTILVIWASYQLTRVETAVRFDEQMLVYSLIHLFQ